VTARAQSLDITCVPDRPVLQTVVATLPAPPAMPSLGCDPVPPMPCLAANPPVVEEWPEGLIQELKLTAIPRDPITSDYVSVTVVAESYDEAASEWTELWTQESEDAVERALAAGDGFVTYGATGLLPGKRHRFRVGWCRQVGSEKGCDCFSSGAFLDDDQDGTADAQPSGPLDFPATPVEQPIVRQLEDRFHRPPTGPKRDRTPPYPELNGDGLGPDEVWLDDTGPTHQNGAHIIEKSGGWLAEIPEAMEISHASRLPDLHAYAEIEFRPHCTTENLNPPTNTGCVSPAENYRVDVRTRLTESAGTLYAYLAQAIYEPDWSGDGGPTDKPTVRIYRGSGTQAGGITGDQLLDEKVVGAPAFDPNTGLGCKIDGVAKSPTDTDVAGLEDHRTKLLRIEARDNPTSVLLTVLFAWDCGSGSCTKSCVWKYEDSAVASGHPLYGTSNHRQGFFVHHWDLLVEAFRAGSEP